MLAVVVAAGSMTGATAAGKTFRLITSEDQLVPGGEYVLVADYPIDTYKSGQKLYSASTDLMSCTAYNHSDNQSMYLLSPSTGYTFVDGTKQEIVVTDSSAILTLEGSKGKWRWLAQNAVDASGKASWGYLQSGVTADDTYHNLTVTAPSSSDYANERTLTSVSFYPTETYYIMNYKAMFDQKMTATNTVHITFNAHPTENATGRTLCIRQDGTHHFGVYAWADALSSTSVDNCPVRLYGLEQVTLKDLAGSEYGGGYTVSGTDLQAIAAVRDHSGESDKYYVVVKDGNGNSVEKVQHNAGLLDYRVAGYDQDNYDQSNWVLVEVTEADYKAFDKKNCKVTSIVGGYYNGIVGDPVIEATADGAYPVINYGEAGDEYVPNTYCPVNFMASYTTDFTGNSIAAGSSAATPGNYFFVNPKAQEYCSAVWAVWDASRLAFYVPAKDATSNREDFDGGYLAYLYYNEGDVQSYSDLTDQTMYSFLAIVKKKTAVPQAPKRRRVNADIDKESSTYVVYPLELNKASVVTGVGSVAVGKTVQRVSYYNLAGDKIAAPQPGVNIVVTTYTDGTTQAAKVMK